MATFTSDEFDNEIWFRLGDLHELEEIIFEKNKNYKINVKTTKFKKTHQWLCQNDVYSLIRATKQIASVIFVTF